MTDDGTTGLSDEGDLTPLAKDIKEVFQKHGYPDPALVVMFVTRDDPHSAHWVTNLPDEDAKAIIGETAKAIQQL